MKFQVTEIEFDFDDDYAEEWKDEPIPQQQIIDVTIKQVWEADDEDDLIEEITCATGWCIRSIDYRHILSWLWHSKNRYKRHLRFALGALR